MFKELKRKYSATVNSLTLQEIYFQAFHELPVIPICAGPMSLEQIHQKSTRHLQPQTHRLDQKKSYFHETIGKMETITVIPWRDVIVRLDARKAIQPKLALLYIPT